MRERKQKRARARARWLSILDLSHLLSLSPFSPTQGRLAATTHTLECLVLSFTAITHIFVLARDFEAGRWGLGGPGLGALWGGALAAAVAGMPASHPAEALMGMVGGAGGEGGAHAPGPIGSHPVEYEGGGHEE